MLHDLHPLLRPLIRRWGVTAAIVGTLALGQAVSAAIFVVADGVLYRPLPVHDPDRLVVASVESPFRKGRPGPVSRPELDELTAIPGVERAAAYALGGLFSSRGDDQTLLRDARVTRDFFDTIGVPAIRGRALTSADAGRVDPRPVVIGGRLWRDQFGRDEQIVGRVVTLGDKRVEVVGVMPDAMDYPEGTNVWLGLDDTNVSPSFSFLRPVLRVSNAAMLAGARISRGALIVESVRQNATPRGGTSLLVLFACALATLMIAWVHLGALQVGLAVDGWQELALRSALGATRIRLSLDRGIQALVLAVSAGVIAMGLVPGLVSAVVAMLPRELTLGQPVSVGTRSLLYLILLTLGGALALAVGPIMVLRESTLALGLRGRIQVLGLPSHDHLRRWLLTVQVALVAALLYVAASSTRALIRMEHTHLGIQADRLVAVDLPRDFGTGVTGETGLVMERLRQLPFVRAVAAGRLPIQPGRLMVSALAKAPTSVKELQDRNAAQFDIGPGFFGALGIQLVHGRDVHDASSQGVYITQALARSLGLDSSAIGRDVRIDGVPLPLAGIVSDVSADAVGEPSRLVFVPSSSPIGTLVVATTKPARVVAGDLTSIIRQAVGARGTVNVTVAADLAARMTAPTRARATLLMFLGLSSLLLGIAGVYSLVRETARRRARDTAIKLALGAPGATIIREHLGELAFAVGGGILLGLGLGHAASGIASRFVVGLGAVDTVAGGIVAAVLLFAASAAAVGPAIRAARVDVMALLRDAAG